MCQKILSQRSSLILLRIGECLRPSYVYIRINLRTSQVLNITMIVYTYVARLYFNRFNNLISDYRCARFSCTLGSRSSYHHFGIIHISGRDHQSSWEIFIQLKTLRSRLIIWLGKEWTQIDNYNVRYRVNLKETQTFRFANNISRISECCSFIIDVRR